MGASAQSGTWRSRPSRGIKSRPSRDTRVLAQAGARRSGAGMGRPGRGRCRPTRAERGGGPAGAGSDQRPCRGRQRPSQLGKKDFGPAGTGMSRPSRVGGVVPAQTVYSGQDTFKPAQGPIIRPELYTSRPALQYVGPACCNLAF
jgi:hypothetical protein